MEFVVVYIIIEHRAKEQCQAICFDVGCAAATPLMQQCVFFLKKYTGVLTAMKGLAGVGKLFDEDSFSRHPPPRKKCKNLFHLLRYRREVTGFLKIIDIYPLYLLASF